MIGRQSILPYVHKLEETIKPCISHKAAFYEIFVTSTVAVLIGI